MTSLKLKLQHLTLLFLRNRKFFNLAFSQEGEDLVLAREFEGKPGGFFVDVGAHHPIRLSNTYKFYLQGWKGINIDAMPGSMQLFKKLRPRDINLEVPISNTAGKRLSYFMFDDFAVNTFDEALATERKNEGKNKFVGKQEMETYTLAQLLEQYVPAGQVINFMSIDVEGLDAEVLQSNDWSRFRPNFVITEGLGLELLDQAKTPAHEVLEGQGYGLWAKTVNSFIYRDRSLSKGA
jgi:FkbM family methyltransferase